MGKTLLYGGSGGIGSAIARLRVKRGNEVHLVGRNEAAISSLANELGCSFTLGDVKDPSLFPQATTDAGENIDSLAYCVGTINLGSLQRVSAEDCLDDFKVNTLGAALAVQAAIKPLKKAGNGSVVFFSSVAAIQGFAMHTSIAMAKGGINGLTLSLAAVLAPKVRVNAIAPSLTQTKLAEPLLKNEQAIEKIRSMHGLQRLGNPEEIAELATYLLSDNAGWMTGQIISVDGGRSTLRINS